MFNTRGRAEWAEASRRASGTWLGDEPEVEVGDLRASERRQHGPGGEEGAERKRLLTAGAPQQRDDRPHSPEQDPEPGGDGHVLEAERPQDAAEEARELH